MFNKSIFIFRRDLRLQDNIGLIEALSYSKEVLPIFIFTLEQVGSNNKYLSNNAVQFMVESLNGLNSDLKAKGSRLYFFKGKPEEIVKKLVNKIGVDAVFVNNDYTPYSIRRDKKISTVCKRLGVEFLGYDDALLLDINNMAKKDGSAYKVYTPFSKQYSIKKISKPKKNNHKNYFKGRIAGTVGLTNLYKENKDIKVNGGRKKGLNIIEALNKFSGYSKDKDFPSINTTLLSASNKFGTVSIREVYYAIYTKLGARSQLLKQLIWRDFFYNIAYYYDVFGKSFRGKQPKWKNSVVQFKKWKEGMTGFPIIDAGMRELNISGFMHNRCRLIVASFLTKILLIDWRKGEQYFAQQLVDYDPCVNNGNWQWCAGTGTDYGQLFRTFNPWTQAKKIDPDCKYIKKWIPELTDVPNKDILNWETYHKDYESDYPEPMVDYKKSLVNAYGTYKIKR